MKITEAGDVVSQDLRRGAWLATFKEIRAGSPQSFKHDHLPAGFANALQQEDRAMGLNITGITFTFEEGSQDTSAEPDRLCEPDMLLEHHWKPEPSCNGRRSSPYVIWDPRRPGCFALGQAADDLLNIG